MRHRPLILVFAAGHPGPRNGGFRLNRFLRFGAAAIAGFLMASCGEHHRSIILDSEVMIPHDALTVGTIARTRNGGFIVTGFGASAWVVATDSRGIPVWQFTDPIDSTTSSGNQAIPQSEFHGAVPLANGNTLLCGGRSNGGQTENLLVVLDRYGRLIQKRTEMPRNDARFIQSNFYRCFLWQDGVLLLGNANDGTHGYIWLVELDGEGVTSRQTFLDNASPVTDVTVAAPSFVFTAWDSQDTLRIIRATAKGETIAKRVIAGEFIVQLRSMADSSETTFMVYGDGRARLYTLDARLQDARPPSEITNFDVLAGCGYVLDDASIALFGRRPNAAIEWIGRKDSSYTLQTLDSKYISSTISDAVPISANQFVTVRAAISHDPREQGLVMSWVTIKDVN